MSESRQDINLSDATNRFLASLSGEKRGSSQPEIFRFIRWFGRERTLSGLTAAEIANYAGRLSTSDTDYIKKLELVRNFLVYAKKEGWSRTNLAVHLKARRGKTSLQPSARRDSKESMALTEQGYNDLKTELEALKSKRGEVIDEIQKAAADKDFRENVPLQNRRL
jgi:site-specific recombinase XerD